MLSLIAAFVAGALNSLAFAPFAWWPLGIISLMILFGLWSPPRARPVLLGLCFGLGQFGLGVSWTYVSLQTFGGMPPALAALCVFALVFALALYPALAGWLQHLGRGRGASARLFLLMPGVWIAVECLRGRLFSGMPWLSGGYAMLDTPLGHLAPLGGVYLVGLIAAMTAGGLLGLLLHASRRNLLQAALLVVVWGAAWQAQHWVWSRADGDAIEVAVIQNNVALMDKWRAAKRAAIIDDYLTQSESQAADLIVWPEAALPDYAGNLSFNFWRRLDEHPADFIFGVLYREGGRHYNSLAATNGAALGLYHKRHLVPFGEFIPLPALFRPLASLWQIPMSDFSAWRAPQPPLSAAGVRFAASICYEDAFPHLWRRAAESGLLVNLSEDMWFGDSFAPHQRLQMARFRARESERAMIRSSNNGLSSLIDWNGEVYALAPQFTRAVVRGRVQPRSGATPYLKYGDLPLQGGVLLLLLLGMLPGRRQGGYNPRDGVRHNIGNWR